jgi:hypothetical protein
MTQYNFVDVYPFLNHIGWMYVPENDPDALDVKRQNLQSNSLCKRTIRLPDRPEDVNTYLRTCRAEDELYKPPTFDLMVLDYITHYSPQVQEGLRAVFRRELLAPGSLLFLIVGRATRGPRDHMRLACDPGVVEMDMSRLANEFAGQDLQPLEGAFFQYQRSAGSTEMWVMGWQIQPIRKVSMPNTITALDKERIASLRSQGVSSAIIAKAFDLKPMQVAAYVAHNTMRQAA